MGARHRPAKTNARSDKLPINRSDKHLDNRACISERHASLYHEHTDYGCAHKWTVAKWTYTSHTFYLRVSAGLQIIHDYLVTWPNTSRCGRFLLFRIKYTGRYAVASYRPCTCTYVRMRLLYVLSAITVYTAFINREQRSSANSRSRYFFSFFLFVFSISGNLTSEKFTRKIFRGGEIRRAQVPSFFLSFFLFFIEVRSGAPRRRIVNQHEEGFIAPQIGWAQSRTCNVCHSDGIWDILKCF